mmetsp:Transcript_78867/g.200734  ORF Transcript_78867/g.200734 Transcript_78867/m.200734 type:complete len:239 (-) Transcript_78867:243-959(-)
MHHLRCHSARPLLPPPQCYLAKLLRQLARLRFAAQRHHLRLLYSQPPLPSPSCYSTRLLALSPRQVVGLWFAARTQHRRLLPFRPHLPPPPCYWANFLALSSLHQRFAARTHPSLGRPPPTVQFQIHPQNPPPGSGSRAEGRLSEQQMALHCFFHVYPPALRPSHRPPCLPFRLAPSSPPLHPSHPPPPSPPALDPHHASLPPLSPSPSCPAPAPPQQLSWQPCRGAAPEGPTSAGQQ